MPLPIPWWLPAPEPVEQYDPDGLKFLQKLLEEHTPEKDRGYMLVVKQEVPDELHDYWDYAPAVNRPVAWSEMSKRQQQVKMQKYLSCHDSPEHKVQKLAQTLKTTEQARSRPEPAGLQGHPH